MSPTLAVAALLGAVIGGGLLLIMLGWRGGTTASGAVRPLRRWGWPPRISPWSAATVLTSGALAGVLTGWIVGAVLAAAAAGTLPRVLRRDPDSARRIARIEAVAVWTEMLRDTLSAAAGLHQAILATAPTAPQVIRDEINELVMRIEGGEPLPGALRVLADELTDPTADLVLAALVLACEHPTRQLAALLGELATEAREQVFMRLRVEAGRARIRTSVRVIVVTTVVFTAGLLMADRAYLAPYGSPLGQLMLLVVGVLFGLGF
ncbi:MAG: type II secretion system F family protein, partial [Pseudonocardiaceae bacterium]